MDLVALVQGLQPGARLVLVGHSSGGGFALRVAAESEGLLFSGFVLLAPYLGYAAPTTWSGDDSGNAPYIGRVIGLSFLNWIGVTALNGLPTLAFASLGRPTQLWSYRLMTNFAADDDYMGDLRRSAARIGKVDGFRLLPDKQYTCYDQAPLSGLEGTASSSRWRRNSPVAFTDCSAARNWPREDWKTCAMPSQTDSVTSTPAASARSA